MDQPFGSPNLCLRSNLLFEKLFSTELTLMTYYLSASLSLLCFLTCVMCCSSSEPSSHLFLHCSGMNYLWSKLSEIFRENQICLTDLLQFLLTKFKGFGIHMQAKIPQQCPVFAILWCHWLERDARIFEGTSSSLDNIWDRVTFSASTCCSAHGHVWGVSLVDMKRDWCALLHGPIFSDPHVFFFLFLVRIAYPLSW